MEVFGKNLIKNIFICFVGAQQLFTWPLPSLEHIFLWKEEGAGSDGGKPLDLNRDELGTFYATDSTVMWWVAFLDGVQRVLMFTDREVVAQQCVRSFENEISNIELNVALDCIGLSLVDNNMKREVLYIGIVSPGPVWVGRKIGAGNNRKLKPLSLGKCGSLSVDFLNINFKYLIESKNINMQNIHKQI